MWSSGPRDIMEQSENLRICKRLWKWQWDWAYRRSWPKRTGHGQVSLHDIWDPCICGKVNPSKSAFRYPVNKYILSFGAIPGILFVYLFWNFSVYSTDSSFILGDKFSWAKPREGCWEGFEPGASAQQPFHYHLAMPHPKAQNHALCICMKIYISYTEINMETK